MNREANVRDSVRHLEERFGTIAKSLIYESKAVGFDGNDFYNQVVCFDTEYSPREVSLVLRDIEARLGRIRSDEKYSSRTVDLDMLLYGDQVIESDNISVPRAEITENAFVLLPLAELAGEMTHPVSGKKFADLWKAFDNPEQTIWPAQSVPDQSVRD